MLTSFALLHYQKGYLTASKPISRQGSCRKSPDTRRRKLVRQNGEQSDQEYRPSSEISLPIAKSFWKAVTDSVTWSYNYNEHEEILKACSEKLVELKKKYKTKSKELLDLDVVGMPSKISPEKRKVKRRAKSMRIERAVTNTTHAHQFQVEPFKSKNIKPDLKKIEVESSRRQNERKTVAGRKFRKGGIVSLATINTNHPDPGSGDEMTEGMNGRKKKKKRKILQISRTVKSAMTAVTAVTFTRKEQKKESLKKK